MSLAPDLADAVAQAGTAPTHRPLHRFRNACRHCGMTLAMLDLRTIDVQPVAGVVLCVDRQR